MAQLSYNNIGQYGQYGQFGPQNQTGYMMPDPGGGAPSYVTGPASMNNMGVAAYGSPPSYSTNPTLGSPALATPGIAGTATAGVGAANPADPVNRGFMSQLTKDNKGNWNFDNLGNLVKGIGAFGSLYMGFQQNKQASEALNFQKEAYQKNLTNSVSSYNLALEDRVRARYAQSGRGSAAADSYINKHKLEA